MQSAEQTKGDMGGQEVLPADKGLGAVWTSGTKFACDVPNLKAHGIGAVVTACNLDFQFPPEIKQLKLLFEDKPEEKLAPQIEKAFQFIQEQRKHTGVVIHCVSGVSRGPAITIGYLMRKEHQPYEQVAASVKAKRNTIQPNPGFVTQLQELQKQ